MDENKRKKILKILTASNDDSLIEDVHSLISIDHSAIEKLSNLLKEKGFIGHQELAESILKIEPINNDINFCSIKSS